MRFAALVTKSYRLIMRRKFLFLGIMLVQFLALFGLALAAMIFLPQIASTTEGFMAHMTDPSQDPLGLYHTYQSLVSMLALMAISMLAEFLLLSGFLWAMSHHLVRKKKLSSILSIWGSYILLGALYIAFGCAMTWLLFRAPLMRILDTGVLEPWPLAGFALTFAVLLYFFTWSSGLLHLRNPFKIIYMTLSVQRKAPMLMLVFLACAAALILMSLLSSLLSWNVALLAVATIIQMVVLGWAKILIITAARRAIKERDRG